MKLLGVDVGGSSIKAGIVAVDSGALLGGTAEVTMPPGAAPEAVAHAVASLVEGLGYNGPVGCGFPAVIRRGVACTAANVDAAWIGTDVGALLAAATGCPVAVANDADLAGLAEMRIGAGRHLGGVVLVLTLGTGIGSALFVETTLVPNTELGHLEIDGRDAESWASARVRHKEQLDWPTWAARLDRYLHRVHAYLWPDAILIGGGVSARADMFLPLLTAPTRILPAALRNDAGVVGAALWAAETL